MVEQYLIESGKRFRERLLGLLAASTALSTIFFWVLSSYFKVDVPASLMFIGQDSWCRVPAQSIGVHCFGDFNERFMPNISDPVFPPFHNNLELSPIGPFLTSFFNFLARYISQQIILIGLVLAFSVLLVFPMWTATKRFSLDERVLWIFLGAVGTYPFIATIDRLNDIALTVPLLFIFGTRFIQSEKNLPSQGYQHFWWIIPILVSIKPQYILLSLIFVFVREFKQAIKSMILSVFLFCFLVVVAGKMDYHRLIEWFHLVFFYSKDFHNAQSSYPLNISISRGLFIVVRLIQMTASAFSINFRISLTTFNFALNIIQVILFLLIAIMLVLYGRHVRKFHLLTVCLVLSSFLFGQFIAGYYTVVILAVLALLVMNPSWARWSAEQDFKIKLGNVQRKQFTLIEINLMTAIILSCTTLAVPAPLTGSFVFFWNNNFVISPFLQQISSLVWLFYVLSVSVKSFRCARLQTKSET